jgi:uncharacterized protein
VSLPDAEHLDGSWEGPGRNPLRAGITGLLLVGAVYSTAGAVVMSVVAGIAAARDQSWLRPGNLVDFLLAYYTHFQVSILVVTAIMEYALFLGLTMLLVRAWHSSRPARYLGWRRPAALDLLLAGLGAIAVVPLAELLDRWSFFLFPVLRELQGGQAALLAIRSPGQLVLVVAAISITPAICEETLFRGWFQRTLRRKSSAVVSVVVTGVIFALFHGSPLSIVALAFVGFYLGYLFERFGTLFASATAHGLYNLAIIGRENLDLPWPWLTTGNHDYALPARIISAAVLVLVILAIAVRTRRRTERGGAG